MREIKFRVWDKENKRMIGNAAVLNSKWLDVHVLRQYDYPVMQYTGLEDKQGVEIYEGDIVKFDARSHYHPEVYAWEYETKGVGIVRYEMGSYVLGGREEARILESLFGILMNYEEIEMEVIGNFYENLELIKELEK